MTQRKFPPPLSTALEPRWFSGGCLEWYRRNGRVLPWRQTRDPYRVLVSEVMLQQTQVDRVLPKYQEWLEKYPTLEALASAQETDVSETWRPLGYNVRPRRLHAIARESVARYGGELPGDEATLRSFKGIGAYTAGAVLSFAFGQRAAILDTNVARVLFRIFVGRGDRIDASCDISWRVPTVLPLARVRFQPGADGPRRNVMYRAPPKCRCAPCARLCHLPVAARPRREESRRAPPCYPPRIVVTAAVIERQGEFLRPRCRGAHSGAGSFPRQAGLGTARGRACSARSR